MMRDLNEEKKGNSDKASKAPPLVMLLDQAKEKKVDQSLLKTRISNDLDKD